jgi:AraC-like DNA-binding protein
MITRDGNSTRAAQVSTMHLSADERASVDLAGVGLYRAMHRDSADDVVRDLRERGADAVVVSAASCDERSAARVARMVHEFPRVPTVALLTRFDGSVGQAVLALGRSGVRTIVDVRQPGGWRELRASLALPAQRDISDAAFAVLASDLRDVQWDCRKFFDCPRNITSVRQLAAVLDVLPSTLMSRFYRTGLPAPKRYLAMARLVRVARMFENPGFSIANVADELEYSSAQSFGRHVKSLLKLTAGEFRDRYDGDGMMNRFREELVLPFPDQLRRLRPLTAPPGWVAARC